MNSARPNPLLSAQEGLHPGTYFKKHTHAMIPQRREPLPLLIYSFVVLFHIFFL